MQSFPTIYRNSTFTRAVLALVFVSSVYGCRTKDDDILQGQISYPFIQETSPIGVNGRTEPFVLKTTVGGTEYVVEIPHEARDYDIQVPLANINKDDATNGKRPKNVGSPQVTDRELEGAMPKIEDSRSQDAYLVDSAFGVSRTDGPSQSPSYSLGIAKVNEFYKRRDYEYALIEINNMLTYYPNSPLLYKMKGTTLLKMRNLPLAELAWVRAVDLDPADASLRKALKRLQQKLAQSDRPSASGTQDFSTPKMLRERTSNDLPLTH